jgi:hypothetical protein
MVQHGPMVHAQAPQLAASVLSDDTYPYVDMYSY